MKRITGFVIAFFLLMPGLPADGKSFKNCAELQKVYRYGVASTSASSKSQANAFFTPKVFRTVYQSNQRLDLDKDGVVCEVKRPVVTKPVPEQVSAKPEPGRLCLTPQETTTVFDRVFTCLTTGSESRWTSGALNRLFQYTTDDGYLFGKTEYCRIDVDAGPEWSAHQFHIKSEIGSCPGPVRFLNYKMGLKAPASETKVASLNPVSCKASSPNNPWLKGFGMEDRAVTRNILGMNAVIQIIPVHAPDTAKPEKTPAQDYGKYFEFVKTFVESVSDAPTTFEIRVPDKYVELKKPLKPFGVSHSLPSPHPTALGEIMQVVDPQIDFTGATTALVLVPPGTTHDVWEQGPLGSHRTAEGPLHGVSSQYPATDKLTVPRPQFANLSTPGFWLHEFFHVGVGLDDHYGDFQGNSTMVSGMGLWGLVSPSLTDLFGWEKWLLGYTEDSQVYCLDPMAATSTFWLRPGSVSTDQPKLGVIPLGSGKVIVLESIRGAGLNHVLRADEQGLMVYEVDTASADHGFGFDLKFPAARSSNLNGSFLGSRAPLKQGEQVSVRGFTIQVIEAGNFGDVVQVSRN